MKLIPNRLGILALAAVSLVVSAASSMAAADTIYDTNDLLLFFQNPTGTTGTDRVVTYSLGSTYDVFRRAATPTDLTFGTTINLGNINAILTSTFGADWTGAASSIFAGAAGQNGATSSLSSTTTNQDYARTVYVTKPRTGAGTVGVANSSATPQQPDGATAQGGLASAISGSNNGALNTTQPGSLETDSTVIDDNNPFSSGSPATAYGQINDGVMGSLSSSTYSLGSVSNIVLGLDLYRATPVLNASGWQNINNITGVVAKQGYYLGTVTLSSNGDVNFVAVPEPSTISLIALAGGAALVAARRRKSAAANK